MAHKVNGVSALHTELMKEHRLQANSTGCIPDRIVNQTNGVTPRRWLLSCNPRLSGLITDTIGDGWVDDLEQLSGLERACRATPAGSTVYAAAKRANKAELAHWMSETHRRARSTPRRCSTSRSSACTNTSAST